MILPSPRAWMLAGLLEVILKDTGIGIPPEDLASLFQRFHRRRNRAAYPGNGLGLAIVKAIADAHGGTITAANNGEGSAFRLELPLEE